MGNSSSSAKQKNKEKTRGPNKIVTSNESSAPPKNDNDSAAVNDTGSDYGIFVLKDKPSDQANVVDIVAIHGLNGHYLDTWTAKGANGEKVIWLKDFLPNQIPDARIMSYGYNSAVQFSKSMAGISEFADQLLENLRSWRQSDMERSPPIIFICHSLGGIVVKQVGIKPHCL